jgi:hypothetical protein
MAYGYGIVVSSEPPICPMCQGNTWQPIPMRLETGGNADGRCRRRRNAFGGES